MKTHIIKIVLVLLGCLGSTYASSKPGAQEAAQKQDEVKRFRGFYLGAAAGAATALSHPSISASGLFEAEFNNELLAISLDNRIYQIRPWGEIFGGWGFQPLSWLYLGARLAFNFSPFNLKEKVSARGSDTTDELYLAILEENIKTRLRTVEFTFDFKPGLVYKNTMFFALIGGAVNRKHLAGSSLFTNYDLSVSPASAFPSSIQVKKQQTLVALRWGLGLEHMLTTHFSVQANYIYTYYRKFKASGSANVISPSGTIINGHNASFESQIDRQVISLGAAYYF